MGFGPIRKRYKARRAVTAAGKWTRLTIADGCPGEGVWRHPSEGCRLPLKVGGFARKPYGDRFGCPMALFLVYGQGGDACGKARLTRGPVKGVKEKLGVEKLPYDADGLPLVC